MCVWLIVSGCKMVWLLLDPTEPPILEAVDLLEAVLFFLGAFFTLAFTVFAFVVEQSRARKLLGSVSCMYSSK